MLCTNLHVQNKKQLSNSFTNGSHYKTNNRWWVPLLTTFASHASRHQRQFPYPDWKASWQDMHQQILKHSNKHDINAALHNLLMYALWCGWQAIALFQPLLEIHNIQQFHVHQSQLGWQQLHYRWLMPTWLNLCNKLHPQLNGTQFLNCRITLIWTAVLKTWELWNQQLHPLNPSTIDQTQFTSYGESNFPQQSTWSQLNDLLNYTTANHTRANHIMT